MLHLAVQRFMCYEQYQLAIEEGKITLLQGKTGAGKTTLLQALTWCLHGKLRGVERRGKKSSARSSRLGVKLVVPSLSLQVHRQKNPNTLEVTHQGHLYVDQEGQGVIDRLFCIGELWECCAYLTERGPNPLLRLKNEDKMEILNLLAFHKDDPSEYSNKIVAAIKTCELECREVKQLVAREESDLQRYLSQYSLSLQECLECGEEADLNTTLAQLEQECLTLKSKMPSHLQRLGAISTSEANILRIQKELEALPSTLLPPLRQEVLNLQRDLETVKQEIEEAKAHHKLQRQRDHCLADIKHLEASIKPDLLSLSGEEVRERERDNERYRQEAQIAQRLNLVYEREVIEAQKREWEETLNAQELRRRGEKGRTLQTRLQSLSEEGNLSERKTLLLELQSTLTSNEKELTTLITQKEQEALLLSCPHCEGYLRITGAGVSMRLEGVVCKDRIDSEALNSRLQELQRAIRSQKQEIQKLTNEISHREQELRERKVLQENLSTLDLPSSSLREIPPPLKEKETERLRRQLMEVQNFTFPPCHDLPIAEIRRYQTLRIALDSLPLANEVKDLSTLERECLKLITLLEQKQRELSIAQSISEREAIYRKQLQDEEERLAKLRQALEPSLPSLIEAKERELREAQRRQHLVRGKEIQRQQSKHATRLQQLEQRLLNLHRFKKIAFDTECQTLDTVVATINANLQILGDLFFEEPINVELTLYRQLKSEDRQKPCVSLKITYEGEDFEGVENLSKGEGDRVSVMLTIALNMISNCPLLLLDEAFDRLDHDTREMCLEGIRQVIKGKTVVVIDHASVEGHHDAVVDVGRKG